MYDKGKLCYIWQLGYLIVLPFRIGLNFCNSFPSAPSAAPTSVRTFSDSSSSITVQWGMVPCIHHNGDITGYSVQYGVVGSGSTQTMSVSGGSVTEATISSLMSSTTYSIQVAAVNSAGIGVYSDPLIVQTESKCNTTLQCSVFLWETERLQSLPLMFVVLITF